MAFREVCSVETHSLLRYFEGGDFFMACCVKINEAVTNESSRLLCDNEVWGANTYECFLMTKNAAANTDISIPVPELQPPFEVLIPLVFRPLTVPNELLTS